MRGGPLFDGRLRHLNADMKSKRSTISAAVIGAGSWGTAIGAWLARNGHDVRVWDIDHAVIDDIGAQRMNSRYLPNIRLPDNLLAAKRIEDAMRACSMTVIAVPSRVFQSAIESVAHHLGQMDPAATPAVVWGTKGFAQQTGELLSAVAERALGERAVTGVISGPSFAHGVIRNLPAGFDFATRCAERSEELANYFRNERTLVYTTDDIVGVQIGGATKNVIAIAAGIADGLGLGINAHCLLVTRGLAEMNRLNVALGGKPETLMGLSGLGDLVLTCSDDLSRNRRLGQGLGQGKSAAQVVAEIGQEVEGIQSAKETYLVGKSMDVFMPTTERIYRILYEDLPPLQAAQELMAMGPSLQNS